MGLFFASPLLGSQVGPGRVASCSASGQRAGRLTPRRPASPAHLPAAGCVTPTSPGPSWCTCLARSWRARWRAATWWRSATSGTGCGRSTPRERTGPAGGGGAGAGVGAERAQPGWRARRAAWGRAGLSSDKWQRCRLGGSGQGWCTDGAGRARPGSTPAACAPRAPAACPRPCPPHPAPRARSEAALAGIKPRSGLPPDLAAEVDLTREGLLKLRQNVVLLRDEEDKDKLYPVRAGGRWAGAGVGAGAGAAGAWAGPCGGF